MEIAIQEALKAREAGDYAVGAVVTRGDEILAKAGNRIKLDQDPTAHAEIVAIRNTARILKSRHLEHCVLYTTHEPCPMCTTATIWARMESIIYGASIEDMVAYRAKNGNSLWSWRTIDIPARTIVEKGDPKVMLVECFMREKCRKLFHA